MNWFKRLFCKHEYEFVRNIYGDEINQLDGKRSEWKCKKCGNIKYRDELYNDKHRTHKLCDELNKLYDEYYENKYQECQNLRSDTLNKITDEMIKAAKCGEYWYDTIIICEETFHDKDYYEKWFAENNLKVEIEKRNNNINNEYKFYIRWKY